MDTQNKTICCDKRKWIIGVVAVVAVVIVAVVGYFIFKDKSGLVSAEPIKIGAMFPLTGGLASYGEPAQKVTAMVMDNINSKGGIGGRKLEINFQDHQCNPKVAVSVYKQLKYVHATNIFTSAACSGTVLALAPGLEKDNSVWVGTITTANKISGSSKNYFRNWASDSTQARSLAVAIKKLNYDKVGILYEETDYAKGLKMSLGESLSGVAEIVSESFVTGSTDLRTQIIKLQNSGAKAIFISPQTVTSGDIILKQMVELKFKPTTLVVNDNVMRSKELRQKYIDLLDVAVSADYNFDANKEINDMLASYKNKYNADCAPLNVCIGAHDSIMLLINAIQNVGSDAVKIRDYIASNQYNGISGTISFDQANDRKDAGYYPVIIKGDGIEKLE